MTSYYVKHGVLNLCPQGLGFIYLCLDVDVLWTFDAYSSNTSAVRSRFQSLKCEFRKLTTILSTFLIMLLLLIFYPQNIGIELSWKTPGKTFIDLLEHGFRTFPCDLGRESTNDFNVWILPTTA